VTNQGAVSSITFQTNTLSSTSSAGTGVNLKNADGAVSFSGTTTLNGGNAGVDILDDSAGTFTFGPATTITSPSGIAFNVDGVATTSTATVTYSGNITQANNSALVNISNHNTGTITFQAGALSATNGPGLQFSNADSTTSYNFNGTTTLNGGDAAIDIFGGSQGTFTFGTNTSINNPSGIAYREDTSTANVTYSGTITKTNNANHVVDINAKTGGTTTFNGQINASTSTANAIDLTSNTGGTINFNCGGNGLDISTTTGTGFNAIGGGVITVQGTGNSITAGTGAAMNLSGVTVGNGAVNGVQFASISSTNAASGITIATVAQGTSSTGIDVLGGTISGVSSRGVDIDATSADVAIGTTISTSAAGRSIEVTGSGRNVAGGSQIVFSGAIDDNGLGINLDNNDQNTQGAVITFSGGLDIDSTTNTGFNATNGGTVNVTGTNTIDTTTGTALNVADTTIGANDLTFQRISAGTGAGSAGVGIRLNNTGALGGLHVTGTGTAGTGGTIQNKTGANGSTTAGIGIYLNNTAEAQFDRMQLNGFENFAIRATDVNGFSLQNSVINGNNGNDAGSDEGAILFENCSGTITLSSVNVSGGFEDNLRVDYFSATADTATYNVTSCIFQDLQSGNNALVNLRSTTAASSSSNVTFNFGSSSNAALGNTFDNSANQNPAPPPATQWFGDGILVTFEGPFQHTINIDKNTFFELFQAIDFAANFSADVTGRIYDNTITYTEGVSAIAFGTGSSSTSNMLFQMLIEDNDIGGLGNDSGSRLGTGIVGDFRGAEIGRITIHQNVVRDVEVNPINIISQATTDGDTNLRITNNTIASIDDDAGGGAGVIPGINVTTNAATNGDIFLTISGNSSTGINEDGILVRQATANNTYSLEDFAGNGAVSADVDTYLEAQNPGTTARVRTGGSVVSYTTMNLNNTNTPAPLTPLSASAFGDEDADGLTFAELYSVAAAAIDRLAAAGASAAQLAILNSVSFQIVDLAGAQLGAAGAGIVQIDINGAGHGYFVDDSPLDDSEFQLLAAGGGLQADEDSEAFGRIDLLTVVLHELGHILGHDHGDEDGLMGATLETGVRHADLDELFADEEALADALFG
jgi:hypothetical protein